MLERYSEWSRLAIMIARVEAGGVGSPLLDTEHMLIGIVRVDPDLFQACQAVLTKQAIRARARHWHTPSAAIPTSQDLPISDDLKRVFEDAVSLADEGQSREVRTEHLLLAMMEQPGCHASVLLSECGADEEAVRHIADGRRSREPQLSRALSFEDLTEFQEDAGPPAL